MKIQMNPTQKTVEIDRNNPFHLSLSISTKTVKEKDDGKRITEFFLQENISVNETELTPLLTKHLHSTNLWYKNGTNVGNCNQDNYSGMTGILVDYDDIMTIQQFKNQFSDYHFIIYPSTNHKLTKDSDGFEIEKFHVILPIDPKEYDLYNTNDMHARAYQ